MADFGGGFFLLLCACTKWDVLAFVIGAREMALGIAVDTAVTAMAMASYKLSGVEGVYVWAGRWARMAVMQEEGICMTSASFTVTDLPHKAKGNLAEW